MTGSNGYGQLTGSGRGTRRLVPLAGLPLGVTATTVDAGNVRTVVLASDGLVYGTGDNLFGQLTGDTHPIRQLLPLSGLPPGVSAVAAESNPSATLVVGSDGLGYGTGSNGDGHARVSRTRRPH